MVTKKQSLILLFAFFFTLSLTFNSSQAAEYVGSCGISVYWGQHRESQEGSLQDACATGNYQYVILEELIVYDNSSTPQLNLNDHCGTPDNPCSNLESQIQYCQSQNIKVFLNIGLDIQTSARRRSIVSSEEAAAALAEYLLEKFLSNNSGPLGNVSLDGMDFAAVPGGTNLKWAEVVKAINASTTDRKIYISAAPQCVYPDYYLNDAINTSLIDYIWVEFFYPNPDCIYNETDGDTSKLLAAWRRWTTNVPNSTILMGLPAVSGAEAGYIPPDVLISDVLPIIKESENYGGIMLRSVYEDKQNDPSYSDQIKDSVCDEECVRTFSSTVGRAV